MSRLTGRSHLLILVLWMLACVGESWLAPAAVRASELEPRPAYPAGDEHPWCFGAARRVPLWGSSVVGRQTLLRAAPQDKREPRARWFQLTRVSRWLGFDRFFAQGPRVTGHNLARVVYRRTRRPPIGTVDLGPLRRLTPISRRFGFDRGLPIDRFYIERFLAAHRDDVRGRVLEIEEDFYTRRFGGDRVTRSDVLHVHAGNPKATIIADLTQADHIPSATFDCIIFTQTLQFISDPRAALRTLHRILKPHGVVLATFPGSISSVSKDEWGEFWYWGFTSRAAGRLFGELFPPTHVAVASHGNVLVASAFLFGLAAEELRPEELATRDRQYEVLVTVRAQKPAQSSPLAPRRR